MSEHAFLDKQFLVKWADLQPEDVQASIAEALQRAEAELQQIRELPREQWNFATTFMAFEQAGSDLNRAWGRLMHICSVSDSPQWRQAQAAVVADVMNFYSNIYVDSALWQVLEQTAANIVPGSLDTLQQRFLEKTLQSFIENGARLPAEQQQKVIELNARLYELSRQFDEKVLDSTNAWELIVDDESKLDGLVASAKTAAYEDALQRGHASAEKPAWRFTQQITSMLPVMQYCHDSELRETFWQGSNSIGSGEWDTQGLVWEILQLRQELAETLGFENFAAMAMTRRMVGTPADALQFVESLHDKVKTQFDADYQQLRSFKAEHDGGNDTLKPWDVAYWSERLRKARYDFDGELLRPYFAIERVLEGMFDLASELFGIQVQQLDVSADRLWHEEVKVYKVLDAASGKHLGSFYTDWHPRESKRAGAWMNCLEIAMPQNGLQGGSAHLGLMCGNMTKPTESMPALLSHSEVETVFHEFGHLLHLLLSEVPIRSMAGTNVAWDFVELPSQIMENWCWQKAMLSRFAKHWQDDSLIPSRLFERMLASRNFQSAMQFMRQLAFAKLDLEMHTDPAKFIGQQLNELESRVLAEYRLPLQPLSAAISRRFLHLFGAGGGYAAGYYSYKYAEVLDADAFSRFLQEGIFNAQVGMEFRRQVLSMGDSRAPQELFAAFMGREPSQQALLERSGIVCQS